MQSLSAKERDSAGNRLNPIYAGLTPLVVGLVWWMVRRVRARLAAREQAEGAK